MAPMWPQDPKKDYDIAVVGGGIGGLCTTIGLLKQGVNAVIYEAAPSFGEIGAGVGLGWNARVAMSMIDPALRAGFDKCATTNASKEHKLHWFTFRRGEDLNGLAGSKIMDMNTPGGHGSVHRARFLDELVKLVPEESARFGKRLENAVEVDGGVELHFADGTKARHSAMIGCDGVKSRTRPILLGNDHPATKPQFSGVYAYRGLIPMDAAVGLLGDDVARNSQAWLGRGGHMLTFPIEHGKTMNVVAFRHSKQATWDNEQWVLPTEKDVMYKDFEGWVEATNKVLSLMRKPDVWALFDHPPAPTYYKGRIAMLGDAAHASTPHQGAGAGQAVEDALVMSRLFAHVDDARDIERAFAAFDKVRRPRSQRQVREARQQGRLYDGLWDGVGDDWDEVAKLINERLDWIWDIDLDEHVKEAEEAYKAGVKSSATNGI